MCPLRLILVFLSTMLAGYFAWRSFRSPAPSLVEDDLGESDESVVESKKTMGFGVKKVIGDGFWAFVDMATGRYLWRAMKER